MASRDIVSALQVKDFRWLWTGSLGSSFAMNMQIVARGWLVYTLTSSAMDLAWVTLSFTLPQVAFSLWGGVVADRLRKKRVIVTAQTANCVATLVMASIILCNRITFWDFIWFGGFNGTVLALSMPARQAFVPELIPDRLIFTAMALNTTSFNLSRILGPALAGLLIAWVAAGDTSSTYGVGVVYLVIAGLYLLSAVSMLLVRRPGDVKEPDGNSPLYDVMEGLRYVRHTPAVLGLILLGIVTVVFGMPLNTLMPAFNEDVLHGGPRNLGFLMSSMGIGAILGSLMLASMGELKNKRVWLVGTCVLWGALMTLFASTRQPWLSAVVVAGIGWLSAWNMSLNRGMLQTQVIPTMRGRIMSIDMMSRGLMPLGVIPISFLAERYSISTALEAAGAAFVVMVLVLAVFTTSVRSVGDELAQPVRAGEG